MLVSERIGQFFVEGDGSRDRLEFTEYGAGDAHVVLLPGPLTPRRMQQPLARALAGEGLHVVTLDLLGQGRSDRPADPHAYALDAWAAQVVALLDHLAIPQAVIGGTSLGANVALEVAVGAPSRVRGLLVEAPVLDHALDATLLTWGSLSLAARGMPLALSAVRRLTRPVPRGVVPFWAGVALDALDQRPAAVAALAHGLLLGRLAPSARLRRTIDRPTLVVGHPADPWHPLADARLLAEEVADATLVQARSALEWRLRPRRLDREAAAFALGCWRTPVLRTTRGAPGSRRGTRG
jgi:pimeloyl-ACP methyl ester carboxylesterase